MEQESPLFNLAVQAIKDEHKRQVGEEMMDSEFGFRVLHIEDDEFFEALVLVEVVWLGYGGGSNFAVVYLKYEDPDAEKPVAKHVVQYIEGERPHITDLFSNG